MLVVYFIALIVIFNSPISFENMFPTIAILIGETFASFFLILLLNRLLYKTNPENLKKYIEFRKDGLVILKDLESNQEIKRINLLPIGKKITEAVLRKTYEFCPNCGSQIKTDTGFCRSCGTNLKI